MSDNRIELDGAIVISEYLLWIDSLDELILDGNIIQDEGMRILLKGAEGNSSLSHLSLERSNLDPCSLNWVASSARNYYFDELSIGRDDGDKSAKEILEKYSMEIANMGKFIDTPELADELHEYGTHYLPTEFLT